MKLSLGGFFLTREDVLLWARELRDRYGGDPGRICRGLGITVIAIRDGKTDWDARLLYRDGDWFVLVNGEVPRVRRDFAIAHELMHWSIIKNTLVDPPAGASLETLCDRGAHELLFG